MRPKGIVVTEGHHIWIAVRARGGVRQVAIRIIISEAAGRRQGRGGVDKVYTHRLDGMVQLWLLVSRSAMSI
jgi:hypothetical protein